MRSREILRSDTPIEIKRYVLGDIEETPENKGWIRITCLKEMPRESTKRHCVIHICANANEELKISAMGRRGLELVYL